LPQSVQAWSGRKGVDIRPAGAAKVGIQEIQPCGIHVAQVSAALVIALQLARTQLISLLVEALDVLLAGDLVDGGQI